MDVIGLIVADLGRAMAFYEQLGLEFPENPDAEGHGHVEATLLGGLRFTLDTEESIRSFVPGWTPPSGGHRTTIAFLCDSPDDVDRLYEELVRAGAPSYKPVGCTKSVGRSNEAICSKIVFVHPRAPSSVHSSPQQLE